MRTWTAEIAFPGEEPILAANAAHDLLEGADVRRRL